MYLYILVSVSKILMYNIVEQFDYCEFFSDKKVLKKVASTKRPYRND